MLLATTTALADTQASTDNNAPENHLVVLQYHHVSTTTPASTSITPEQFTTQLDWLAENNYSVTNLPDALNKLRAGEALADKTVAITFDDGYLDNYTTAYPILREHGWPFTIFVNPQPHDQKLKGWASWEQLKEMSLNGATIANHTTSHLYMLRQLKNETTPDWQARLSKEMLDAETRIEEETGQTHRILAYPYGESNAAIRKLVEKLDFIAFGQQSGAIGPDSDYSDLPRFPLSGAYSNLDTFITKMKSLPMPVFSATPDSASGDGTLNNAETRPVLVLQLHDTSPLALNCFASGQGSIPVSDQGEGRYRMRAPKSVPVGRSRYNCTYASEWKGRFYWYSYAWIRRNKANAWSHE
jgi:peptidoglycan/xylan/chitin deacetylase (PgdA/CDA1 family)